MNKFSMGIFILIFLGCAHSLQRETAFYVSPSGNDSWSGKLAQPNQTGTDGPFATFERARDVVRTTMASGSVPKNGITVYIRNGIYRLNKSLELTAEDSGTEKTPVIWCAYPDETVIIQGGITIRTFTPVTEPEVLERIDNAYQDKIFQADLHTLGITNYGEIDPSSPHRMELFYKGKYMTIARYPNEGWLEIADVPQFGKLINKGCVEHSIRFGIPPGRHYGRFVYDGNRPERWATVQDIWMHGFWVWDWADSYQKVLRIDTIKKEIWPAEPHHIYGYHKEQRYYFLNLLEELDSPGEYYIDHTKGILYFWSPEPIRGDEVQFPLLEEPMIVFKDASFITIQGITFECSRSGAVKIQGGSHDKIAGCTMRNLGDYAVILDGGKGNGVTGCDIYEVGSGGIFINAGDRKTLTPATNYATNNHIHHYSRVRKTYQSAIAINGVGNLMAHNLIHDAPHVATLFNGNDHIIEYNEIHDIAQETGDVGAVYIGRDWTQRGTIIRHNYFHHIKGPGLFGASSVYLDDWASGITVYGNVFYNTGRGVLIGGGRDNVVENNIFVNSDPSIHLDARGIGWAKYYFEDKNNALFQGLNAVNYQEPPYSTNYPHLATILDDDPQLPKYNKIVRNVSYGGRWLDFLDGLNFSIVTMENNLIADPVLCRWRKKLVVTTDLIAGFTTYKNGDTELMDILEGKKNVIINTDPGFIDLAHENFQLKSNSPAYKLGFKRIPIEKIGLYIDEYRTSSR